MIEKLRILQKNPSENGKNTMKKMKKKALDGNFRGKNA